MVGARSLGIPAAYSFVSVSEPNAFSVIANLHASLRSHLSGFSDVSYLELSEGETTAEAGAAVILDSAAHKILSDLHVLFECCRNAKVVLTGTGQWGGACQPGEGQEQQPWPGERHGGKPSCQPIVFPSVRIIVPSLQYPPPGSACVVLTNLVEVAPDAPLPILAEI